MHLTLSAGDRIHIGNDVTLTVLRVQDGWVQFGLQRRKSIGPGKPLEDEYESPASEGPRDSPGHNGERW